MKEAISVVAKIWCCALCTVGRRSWEGRENYLSLQVAVGWGCLGLKNMNGRGRKSSSAGEVALLSHIGTSILWTVQTVLLSGEREKSSYRGWRLNSL